jgi:hypothetical protein
VRATSAPSIAASAIPPADQHEDQQQDPAQLVFDLGQGPGDQHRAARPVPSVSTRSSVPFTVLSLSARPLPLAGDRAVAP